MSTPLLRTKLYAPPVRPELVWRPRLIERLNAGLEHKLTLVSAPAGYGKTTLLSEWVHSVGAGLRPAPTSEGRLAAASCLGVAARFQLDAVVAEFVSLVERASRIRQ